MLIAWISCAGAGEVHTVGLDTATGQLRSLSVCAPGGQLMPMARHPTAALLYVVRRSEPLSVVACRHDEDGGLAVVGEAPLPASMAYVAVSADATALYTASYGGDCIAVSDLSATGLPSPARQVIETPPKAHAILPSPCGRWVLSTHLGADVLRVWRPDPITRQLALHAEHACVPGSGPRHLRFTAAGDEILLLGELDAKVHVLAWDATSGTPTARQAVTCLPPAEAGGPVPWAAELQVHGNDRAWMTDRGRHLLVSLARDRRGDWQVVGHLPTESQPRGMAVSPDGRWLLVAGQTSAHVTACRVASDGRVEPVARLRVGDDPNWITFMR